MDTHDFKIWLEAQQTQLNQELDRCLKTQKEAEFAINILQSDPIKKAMLLTHITELDKIISGIKHKQTQLEEYPEILAIIAALDTQKNTKNTEKKSDENSSLQTLVEAPK